MEPTAAELVRRRIRWRQCYRVIPSRFPPVDLFARVADTDDLDALHELESLTNDRLRDQSGEICLVTAEDRATGAGAAYVMAPFTHISQSGGRFNTPQFGAYYAARVMDTAVAESSHHRENFMRATRQPALELDMRVLAAELDARLHDVRGMRQTRRELYEQGDYSASQQLAAQLRAAGSDGIVYDSVRHEGGQCVAVFRPKRLKNCRPLLHLSFVWDGERIRDVYEKRPYGDDV